MDDEITNGTLPRTLTPDEARKADDFIANRYGVRPFGTTPDSALAAHPADDPTREDT